MLRAGRRLKMVFSPPKHSLAIQSLSPNRRAILIHFGDILTIFRHVHILCCWNDITDDMTYIKMISLLIISQESKTIRKKHIKVENNPIRFMGLVFLVI